MADLQITLANPRGFCAGVDRAIEIVERALDAFGAPIYVRHEVVHNRFVVDNLSRAGAVFVDDPARASRITSRGREYALRGICITYEPACNWRDLTYDEFVATLDGLEAQHAEAPRSPICALIVRTGTAWLSCLRPRR